MKRRLAIWIGILVGAVRLTAAQGPILIVPPLGPFSRGDYPSVVATAEGFAAAWWDYEHFGEPGCVYGCLRFQRFDPAGVPIGERMPATITSRFDVVGDQVHLEPAGGGFALFVEDDGVDVYSIPLDASGAQSGPSSLVVESIEMYPMSIASNASTIVLVHPEWFGTWLDRVQPLDRDGVPTGPPWPIEIEPWTPAAIGSIILDSPVARDGNGFVTAWYHWDLGLKLRDLSSSGRPVNDVLVLQPAADDCGQQVAIAALGGRDLVFFSSGCPRRDLQVIVRDRRTGVSDPIPIAADPQADEGWDGTFDVLRGIKAVALGGRIGVLFMRADLGPAGQPLNRHWMFVEVGPDGFPLSSPRDLTAEFGLDIFHGEISLRPDEYRGRYLLSWMGDAPDGTPGIWVLPLPS